jgi:hypothetical protein
MVNALHASYVQEGPLMTLRAHRLVAAGALAVAAVATPIAVAFTSVDSADTAQCRAHFGNLEDNICLDGPDSGNSFTIGTPSYNGGNSPDSGFYFGPVLPGTTWTQGIG